MRQFKKDGSIWVPNKRLTRPRYFYPLRRIRHKRIKLALARVTSNFFNQATTSTTISIAWTPAQAGNMLIVSYFDTAGSLPTYSIADTNTNTWATVCPATRNAGFGANAGMSYCTSCKAGATTITVTTLSSTSRGIYVSEWSGQDQTAAFDQHSEATGASTTPNSGAKTTTLADEVIYGFAISGPSNLTAGGTFTAETNSGSGDVPEWKIVSSIASYSADWTVSTGSWIALMGTFKQALPVVASASLSAVGADYQWLGGDDF